MMPVKITKISKDRYRVATPNGVKVKSTTKEKAYNLQRLLNALEHGWKPTKRSGK